MNGVLTTRTPTEGSRVPKIPPPPPQDLAGRKSAPNPLALRMPLRFCLALTTLDAPDLTAGVVNLRAIVGEAQTFLSSCQVLPSLCAATWLPLPRPVR